MTDTRASSRRRTADYCRTSPRLRRRRGRRHRRRERVPAGADVNTAAGAVPGHELRDRRLPVGGARETSHANALGLTFKSEESGYLVGYLAALMAKAKGGTQVISAVGGQKIPSVDNWIAGYRAGAQEGRTRRSRCSSATRASSRRRGSEVQGDRAEPDRPGRAGRSSRSPAAAASARSTRRSRRRCGASASTPTSTTWARTS